MLNRATLIGRLGDDPVIRYTKEGKGVVTISVATSETWKDKQSGERKEKTEWHRVVLFGKLAETASQHLKKGNLALFEGSIRNRKWQESSGAEKYSTEIHADSMKMLPSGNGKNLPESQPETVSSTHAPDDYGDYGEDIPY